MKPTESELRRLYETEGLSTRAVADLYGVSHMSIKRWLKAFGIKARCQGRGLANRGVEPPTKDDLFRLIHVEHIGYEGVAAKYGVDPSAVRHWLIKHDIARPKLWETRAKGAFPEIPPGEVRRLYGAGRSLEFIADVFGVSKEPIRAICEKHGIEVRPDGFNRTRYLTKAGLSVRSTYEQRVADWLDDHSLSFVYEPRYPFSKTLRADFLVNGWYVEVWGITDNASYRKRRDRKIRLCAIHQVPLIQIKTHYFSSKRRHMLDRTLSRLLPV